MAPGHHVLCTECGHVRVCCAPRGSKPRGHHHTPVAVLGDLSLEDRPHPESYGVSSAEALGGVSTDEELTPNG